MKTKTSLLLILLTVNVNLILTFEIDKGLPFKEDRINSELDGDGFKPQSHSSLENINFFPKFSSLSSSSSSSLSSSSSSPQDSNGDKIMYSPSMTGSMNGPVSYHMNDFNIPDYQLYGVQAINANPFLNSMDQSYDDKTSENPNSFWLQNQQYQDNLNSNLEATQENNVDDEADADEEGDEEGGDRGPPPSHYYDEYHEGPGLGHGPGSGPGPGPSLGPSLDYLPERNRNRYKTNDLDHKKAYSKYSIRFLGPFLSRIFKTHLYNLFDTANSYIKAPRLPKSFGYSKFYNF